MDICVKFLAIVPWSEEEKKQICEIYDCQQFFYEFASDLCKHLESLPKINEGMQQNLFVETISTISFI